MFGQTRAYRIEKISIKQENQMKSFRLTIGAALLSLTAAIAMAQGGHGPGGPGFEFHHLLRQLDLSSTQQEQVKAIFQQEKPKLQALHQQMEQNRSAMDSLQANGPFDENKTRTLASQNSSTMVEMEVEHQKIKSEIEALLTPDQKTKLAQLQAEHEQRMSQHSAPPSEE
jgi:periplasmic protein CpxP/Spy